MARPAPEERVAPPCTFSFGAQMALDEAEATRPKVFECSYFLYESAYEAHGLGVGVNALTSRISP